MATFVFIDFNGRLWIKKAQRKILTGERILEQEPEATIKQQKSVDRKQSSINRQLGITR